MKTLEYKIGFATPAFLGNAEQQAQWRTPPFKALLREWWRIARAKDFAYDPTRLLDAEKRLFGAAGEEGKPWGRSRVQLRLTPWDMGDLDKIPEMAKHLHPEVKDKQGQPIRVATAVYLGFGPVTLQGSRKAIAPGAAAGMLRLHVPDEHVAEIEAVMQLAAWFGALGSRSRNGWGGLQMEREGLLKFSQMTDVSLARIAPALPLEECLCRDWPHAIGLTADGRLAVWRVIKGFKKTENGSVPLGFDTWREAMEKLAHVKITFRTEFKFSGGKPHPAVEQRHVLAYPVTNHDLAGLQNARLANQLRFRVARQSGADGEKFFGTIVHLPCAMPSAFFERTRIERPAPLFQAGVWRRVHEILNTGFPGTVVPIRKAAA